MADVDIKFDQNKIQDYTKMILNASTTEQVSFIKKSYQIIVETAQQLKEKYQIMLNDIANFETAMKKNIMLWHNVKKQFEKNGQQYKNTQEYDTYLSERLRIKKENLSEKVKTDILQIYSLAMKFQNYLNASLGQEVVTAYVWVNSKGVPETYIIHDMTNFLKVDVDKMGNIVVRYRNNKDMLKKHADKIENSIKENTASFNYTLLKSTYHDVYYRYHRHKVSKGGAYILWLYPFSEQKWNGAYVSSFGSINEGYASLLLHQHYIASLTPEDNMEQFMNQVLGITNLSGTLQGDITVGNMEIAVKSAGATVLSIKQLYNIAQDISNNKLNNFKAIQNYLNSQKKNNKLMERPINKSLKASLQNIGNETLGQMLASYEKQLGFTMS